LIIIVLDICSVADAGGTLNIGGWVGTLGAAYSRETARLGGSTNH